MANGSFISLQRIGENAYKIELLDNYEVSALSHYHGKIAI